MLLNYSRISTFLVLLIIFVEISVCQDYNYDYEDSSEPQKPFEPDAVPQATKPTDLDSETELRKKLFPPNLASHLDRSYERTGQCYRTDTQGPCGENMIFYAQIDNAIYGTCDCERTDRKLIYHRATDKCYFIFKQAYCRPGQWLTLSRSDGLPACEPNPCIQRLRHTLNRDEEFVPYKGKCIKLNSMYGRGQIITFRDAAILPECYQQFDDEDLRSYSVGLGAPKLKCSPGSAMSFTGKCLRNWVW